MQRKRASAKDFRVQRAFSRFQEQNQPGSWLDWIPALGLIGLKLISAKWRHSLIEFGHSVCCLVQAFRNWWPA
jgi:hypothetical protein